MSILIRKLDDGYLVTDNRGPVVWEGAAVTFNDAQTMAENRLNPRLPSPPPGKCNDGYPAAEPSGGLTLAEAQFDQAIGTRECVGSLCSLD
jgi:hypothetical protein